MRCRVAGGRSHRRRKNCFAYQCGRHLILQEGLRQTQKHPLAFGILPLTTAVGSTADAVAPLVAAAAVALPVAAAEDGSTY